MTTIATDGRSMAGDGQRNHRDTITDRRAVKVRRIADGSLVGSAGDVAFNELAVEWIDGGMAGDPPKLEMDGGCAMLILRPDGTLLLMGQDCRPCPIQAPYAVGSGMDLAIGAMAAGASPEKAVELASDYDPHTGGKITVLHLEQKIRAAA